MASNLRLAILASGVILFHTSVTVLEEQLFRNEHFRATGGGAFMTLVSYSLAAVCFGAAVYRQKSAAATKGVGLVEVLGGATRAKDLLTVVTVYVGTTTLTKTSLRYIDVPTQTILKSAKLLPVMAGSILILRRSFHRREWIAALMLVSGMVAFSSSSARPSLQQGAAGSGCILVALVCDALLGPYQQRVLSRGVKVAELMLYQSAGGACYMLVVCAAQGSLLPGLQLLATDATVALLLAAWAIALTIGTALVMTLVADYSAVVAICVTTLRKALSILCSFVLFPKLWGWGHPIGMALVLASVFVAKKAKKPPRQDAGPQAV